LSTKIEELCRNLLEQAVKAGKEAERLLARECKELGTSPGNAAQVISEVADDLDQRLGLGPDDDWKGPVATNLDVFLTVLRDKLRGCLKP
jgi:hypothetical protein